MTWIFEDEQESLKPSQYYHPISGPVTSGFNDPRGDRLHYGIDIGAPPDTDFYAPRKLQITAVRNKMSNSPGGMVWAVDPETGLEHRFHHVQPGVGVGDVVNAGMPLGKISNIKGPHLDWKVRNPKTGRFVNIENIVAKKGGKTVFGKLYDWIMPTEAQAAEAPTDQWVFEDEKPTANQWVFEDEKPGVGPSIAKNVLQPDQVEFDTYAEPSQRAGELIKKGIEKTQEYAFLPLNKALTYFHKGVIEPVRKRDITSTTDIPPAGLGAPEAFAPLPTEQEFVPTMEFALAPAYLKLIGKATSILGKVGKQNFYKYAPDWMFRKGEAGLPEILSPKQIEAKLLSMTGKERAEYLRKYPEFAEIEGFLIRGEKVPYEIDRQGFKLVGKPFEPIEPVQPGIGAIGRPQVAGELVTPQPKLPPGQGFKFGPQTILRKPPAPEPPPPNYYYPPEELGGGTRVPPERGVTPVETVSPQAPPVEPETPVAPQAPVKEPVKITPNTPETDIKFNVVSSDDFLIETKKGAKISGYYKNADVPGTNIKSSINRGELFYVEVPENIRKQGIGLSLSRDALNLLKANGVKSVVIRTTTEGGKSLVKKLIESGDIGNPTIKPNDRIGEYPILNVKNYKFNKKIIESELTEYPEDIEEKKVFEALKEKKRQVKEALLSKSKTPPSPAPEVPKKTAPKKKPAVAIEKDNDVNEMRNSLMSQILKEKGITPEEYAESNRQKAIAYHKDVIARRGKLSGGLTDEPHKWAERVKASKKALKELEKNNLNPDQDLKYLYSGLPIPNLGKVLNKYFAKVPKKDMNMFARYTEMPFWRAQRSPRGKKVYDVQSNRELERNVAMDVILGEMDDTITFLKNLPKDQFKRVNDAAFYFDEYRIEPTDQDLISKFNFAPEEIKAYRKVREMLEWVKEDYFQLLSELGMPKNEIDELRREMGSIPGYIPHRRKGRHEVGASHIDPETGAKVTDYYEQFDDMVASVTGRSLKYKGKAAEVKAKYPESRVWTKPVEEIPEDYYWHVDTQNMQAIIDAAVGKMQGPNEALRSELVSAAAKTLMQRGFGQHFIKRKNIPGYDKSDFLAATLEHLMGYYGFKTKMRAAKDFQKQLAKFPATSKERLYWEKYVRDMLSNTTQWDRVTDKVRAGAFLWFLAGVPRQVILQPTQNFIAGVPVLQQHTKWSSGKILAEMTKMAAGIAKRNKLGHLDEDIKTGIKVAKSKGIIDAQLTHEYEGYLKNTMGKAGEKLSKVARFFIGNAEIFNRESMYAVAYKIARTEHGKDHLQSMKFAEDIIKQVHFEYGKKNLPPFARGGDVAKLARTAYTFRTFNHNLFNLYYDLGKKGTKGGEGLLKGLGYLLLFGGLSSLPFGKDLESFYQKKTGKNIRSEIRKEFPTVGRYLNQGLPALAGIDLSASMGIESIKSGWEALGVPYSMVQMPIRSLEQIGRKDYYRAVEDIAPSVVKGPMAAYRQYTKGVTTRRGKPILDDEGKPMYLTGPEAIARALSFQTPRLTETYQKHEARQEEKIKWNDERKELIETHRLAKLNHGITSDEAKAALKDIQEFNKKLRDEKIRFIPPITMKTLKGRPETKREKALRKEYQ